MLLTRHWELSGLLKQSRKSGWGATHMVGTCPGKSRNLRGAVEKAGEPSLCQALCQARRSATRVNWIKSALPNRTDAVERVMRTNHARCCPKCCPELD